MTQLDSLFGVGNRGTDILEDLVGDVGGVSDIGEKKKEPERDLEQDDGEKEEGKEKQDAQQADEKGKQEKQEVNNSEISEEDLSRMYKVKISGREKELPLKTILRQAEQVGGLTNRLHELEQIAEDYKAQLERLKSDDGGKSQQPSIFDLPGEDQLSPFGDGQAVTKLSKAVEALNNKIAALEVADAHVMGERMVNTIADFVQKHPLVNEESASHDPAVKDNFIQRLERFGIRKALQRPTPAAVEKLGEILTLAYRDAAFEHQADAAKRDEASKIAKREEELAKTGAASHAATPGGKTKAKEPKRKGQGFHAGALDVLEEMGMA